MQQGNQYRSPPESKTEVCPTHSITDVSTFEETINFWFEFLHRSHIESKCWPREYTRGDALFKRNLQLYQDRNFDVVELDGPSDRSSIGESSFLACPFLNVHEFGLNSNKTCVHEHESTYQKSSPPVVIIGGILPTYLHEVDAGPHPRFNIYLFSIYPPSKLSLRGERQYPGEKKSECNKSNRSFHKPS